MAFDKYLEGTRCQSTILNNTPDELEALLVPSSS
jgi:hypothetical protein